MKLMLLQSIATKAKQTRPKPQNQKGVLCNAGTLHKRKKRGPCIIQRKRQLWHSSESGTGELLGVKIQFPQVTHSVQRKMPLLSNNIKQSCNSMLCTLSNSSTGAVLYSVLKNKRYSFYSVSVGRTGSVLFNTLLLYQY